MDYIATGELEPGIVAGIIEGLARACKEANCPLIGGETAEMPGFYAPGEYDVAGFIVGAVSREKIIDGSKIAPGDVLIGLPSLGLHTNGYSLARKIFFDARGYKADSYVDELGCTVGEELLKPHKSYLPALEGLFDSGVIKGLAHLTGGGFLENIPRILPEHCAAMVERESWPVLPVFKTMEKMGNVDEQEMYRVFNMGIGMVVVASPEDSDRAVEHFKTANEPCYRIGRIEAGEKHVELV